MPIAETEFGRLVKEAQKRSEKVKFGLLKIKDQAKGLKALTEKKCQKEVERV